LSTATAGYLMGQNVLSLLLLRLSIVGAVLGVYAIRVLRGLIVRKADVGKASRQMYYCGGNQDQLRVD